MSDAGRCEECGEPYACEDKLTAAQARIAELERELNERVDRLDAQCKRYEADVTKWFDRAAELERQLATERQTGGPCCVCAGSGKLLTDEPCGVCSGSGEAHQERHGLRVVAQAGERRIAALEHQMRRGGGFEALHELCQNQRREVRELLKVQRWYVDINTEQRKRIAELEREMAGHKYVADEMTKTRDWLAEEAADEVAELEATVARVTAERDDAYAIARGYQVLAEMPADVLALGDEVMSDEDAALLLGE